MIAIARETGAPVTARGSGTGLSGACVPRAGGILIAFREMAAILEIDVDNQTAIVQPGVTLRQLDEATEACGLVYPVFPGESSASLGGSVATNAGGMRAVKYGVTRQQVLGLEAVLGTGEVIRTGGKFVKSTSGYDLTQLIVGSEGTLAVVTEATLRLYPRPECAATVLAPFRTIDAIAQAVPKIIQSGVAPLILEYIDTMTMTAITAVRGLELGIGSAVKDAALAYLVVVLEFTGPGPPGRGHRASRRPDHRTRGARRVRAAAARGVGADRGPRACVLRRAGCGRQRDHRHRGPACADS